MTSKLTDSFKSLRLIPVPFGEYQGNNPDTPPIMVCGLMFSTVYQNNGVRLF